MVPLHLRVAIGGFDAPQRQQCAALDAEIMFDPRKQRLVLSQRFLAGDDAPVRYPSVDVLPDLLVEFRLVAISLNTVMSGAMWAMTRFQVASEIPLARARSRKPSRHRSKPGGVAKAATGCASRMPAPRPDRRSARRVGAFRKSGCSSGQLAAGGRNQSQGAGTGQKASNPRRFWPASAGSWPGLGAKPGHQPPLHRVDVMPAFVEQRPPRGQRPLQHPAVHRMRYFPDARSRSRLRMMTPTVAASAAPPARRRRRKARIGVQHRKNGKLRRRDPRSASARSSVSRVAAWACLNR